MSNGKRTKITEERLQKLRDTVLVRSFLSSHFPPWDVQDSPTSGMVFDPSLTAHTTD